MGRERPEGTCNICGKYGQLSFEHVPPKAAFNNRPVVRVGFEEGLSLGPDEIIKGPIQQKGMGAYTLCEKCNNDTGGWYGHWFVDWCYQGMDALIRSNGQPSLIYLNYLFPLRIIKQIATMFFSVNGPAFRENEQELVRFVLNKEARYLSSNYRFFVYYNIAGHLRAAGIAGLLNIQTHKTSVLSEITFPPFGYMLTLGTEPPDKRLVEITHFARYSYNDWVVMPLKLPTLPTYTLVPGDYRDKEQIYQEAGMLPPDSIG